MNQGMRLRMQEGITSVKKYEYVIKKDVRYNNLAEEEREMKNIYIKKRKVRRKT